MVSSNNVRSKDVVRELFRDVDVSGGYRAYIEELWELYYEQYGGFTDVAVKRLAELAKALKEDDIASADEILCRWGIRK